MLLPTLDAAILLCIAGFVLSLVTLYPDEQRWVRLGLCLSLGAAVLIYLDWRTGLLLRASAEDIRGTAWVWGFYRFESVAFGEYFLTLWQLAWLTDRTPEADRYESEWRSHDPATLPAVDVWVATYDEERPILEQTMIGLKHLDWPPEKLKV